jgi:hypothetical protein
MNIRNPVAAFERQRSHAGATVVAGAGLHGDARRPVNVRHGIVDDKQIAQSKLMY